MQIEWAKKTWNMQIYVKMCRFFVKRYLLNSELFNICAYQIVKQPDDTSCRLLLLLFLLHFNFTARPKKRKNNIRMLKEEESICICITSQNRFEIADTEKNC